MIRLKSTVHSANWEPVLIGEYPQGLRQAWRFPLPNYETFPRCSFPAALHTDNCFPSVSFYVGSMGPGPAAEKPREWTACWAGPYFISLPHIL